MDRRLVRQINALNGDQFNFQPGRVHGILLIFEGTNATGQTGGLDDLGSVLVTRDGRQIVNATVQGFGRMGDIRFGSNLFSSTEAGSFLASVFIPFFESGKDDAAFNNALAISGDSELNFEWVPKSGIADTFDSITLSTFAELAAYAEKYEYRILRDDQSESGAVSGKPYQLNKANITGLYLTDPDDVVSQVQLEQSGRSVYSPQSWDALLAGTLLHNDVNGTTYPMIELETFSKGNLASAVNRDSVLTLTTSGGGTVPVLTTSIHIW